MCPAGSMDRAPDMSEVVDLSALANLPGDEVVPALLRQALKLLAVDVVNVLLLDGSGTQLLAHSSAGLDDEVRQGFRLPVGAGFAGRVAATNQSAVLADVGPDTVANHLIIEHGIVAMAGVPLRAHGRMIGVIDVGSRSPRTFDAHDLEMLAEIGDHVATALEAERSRDETRAVHALQRSLLPTRLPSVEGLEFAARYVPAEGLGVGGDWYDAFALPGGRLVVVVGDVAGHGLPAAVVMGRLRSVVRSYAFESDDPADVLRRASDKFTHFEPSEMATILVVQFAPSLADVVVASAGHPPPVLVTAHGEASFVAVEPAPPIGFRAGGPPRNTTFEIADGSTLLCFTDGLFERRGEPIDESLDRVRRAMRPGPVDQAVNVLMSTMIGRGDLADDTAVVATRKLPSR